MRSEFKRTKAEWWRQMKTGMWSGFSEVVWSSWRVIVMLGCTEVSLIMHLCFSDCLLSFSFIVWVRMTLPMCLSFDVCVWVWNSSLHNKNFTFSPQHEREFHLTGKNQREKSKVPPLPVSLYYTMLDYNQGHHSVPTNPALHRSLINPGCSYLSCFTSEAAPEVKAEQGAEFWTESGAEFWTESGVEFQTVEVWNGVSLFMISSTRGRG